MESSCALGPYTLRLFVDIGINTEIVLCIEAPSASEMIFLPRHLCIISVHVCQRRIQTGVIMG